RAQDGELGQARRQGRLVAAMSAKALREFTERRCMQERRERPANAGRFSAWSRTDRFQQRALGAVHRFFGQDCETGCRALCGHWKILEVERRLIGGAEI